MPVRARRVVVSSATLLVVAGPALAAGSPSQSSIIAAVRAQRSFHYVAVSTGNGVQLSIVGDAARDRGVQRITYRRGGVSGHVTVLVAADTAYIRGDAFTLRHYMSFAAAAASKYANRWLRLPDSAPGFASVAADVRLDSSTLRELRLPSPVHDAGTAVVDGQRVKRLEARLSHAGETATATLYVRAAGAPLPVRQTVVQKGRLVADVRYDRWNERVHVSPPARSTPLP